MSARTAYVLSVAKLTRKHRRLGQKMLGLAKSCVRWLHYGWAALTNAKFLRVAAASLAFAATMAATGQGVSAGGTISPINGGQKVNQYTNWPQDRAKVAMDGDGDFVAVWVNHPYYSTPRVQARLYKADGTALTPEFGFNFNGNGQDNPDVAMDSDGNFVVVWQQYVPGRNDEIVAQRFDAAGNVIGGRISINNKFQQGQRDPSIAMDADGDFVVTWTSPGIETYYSSSYGYQQVGIAGRLFDSTGTAKGDQFLVNNTLPAMQDRSDVAMDRDGDFVVTWQSNYNDGDVMGVMARRFDAEGNAEGYEFEVNTGYYDVQDFPRVGMDADGDFVVVWHSYYQASSYNSGTSNSYYVWKHSILMRRFEADGTALGDDEVVAEGQVFNSTHLHFEPDVAVDAEGEIIVVYRAEEMGQEHIRLARFDGTGAAIGSSQIVNPAAGLPGFRPAVAADHRGDLVVIRDGNGIGDGNGIFARRYDVSADAAAPVVGGLYITGDNERILPGELLRSERVGGFTITFSEKMIEAGVENLANWGLTHNGDDVGDVIEQVTYAFNTDNRRYEAEIALVADTVFDDGEYVLTLQDNVKDLANNALDGDFDGAAGGDYNWTFNVASQVSLGTDINTSDSNLGPGAFVSRGNPSVAMDDDGNYIVAWHEVRYFYFSYFNRFYNADLRWQRYFADGTPNGDVQSPDFNFTTHGNSSSRWEVNPKVAMDADGDIVIVFNTYPGGGVYGSYASNQLFALGFNNDEGNLDNGDVTYGTAVLTNPNAVTQHDVACDADGDFVVVARGIYGQWHVFAQRFNANGIFAGPPFEVVEQYYTGQPQNPKVAMDDDGDYVVTWQSPPFSDFRIMARRFNRYGMPVSGNIIVSDTSGFLGDFDPDVAMDHDGDFVVVWDTYRYYSYSSNFDDVAMRRFSFDGTPLDDVQIVDSTTTSVGDVAIAMDDDGEFVVTWTQYGDYTVYSGPSSSYSNQVTEGIFARRFNALGAPQGDSFGVNFTLNDDQNSSAVAMDADGDFVVGWFGYVNQISWSYSGYYSYSYTSAVIHRRFGTNEAPTTLIPPGATAEYDEDADIDPLPLRFAFRDSTDLANLTYTVEVDDEDLMTAEITGTGSGAELQLTLAPDANGETDLTIRATDSRGLFVETTVTFTVNPVNDAPVLTPDTPDLTDVLENEFNSAGNTVAEILGDTVTDVDDGAVEGIAITGKTGNTVTEGRWQYSTNGGSSWTNVPGVSNAGALLLRATDKLRFVPVAGYFGSATITYRAWDQTSGTVATLVDLSGPNAVGGIKAYSLVKDTATVQVNSINDAPVLNTTDTPTLTPVNEDEIAANVVGTSVSSLIGSSITDLDPGAVQGIAITYADGANGTWQSSLNGTDWISFYAPSDGAALLLRPTDMIRFVPNADFEGSAAITYRAWDQTSGVPGTFANTLPAGGESAFSTDIETATVDVLPINDQPTLVPFGPDLTDVDEDDADPAGDVVSDILDGSVQDIDVGAIAGIAVTGVSGTTHGSWEYSTDGGSSWTPVAGVSGSNALLLQSTDMLRFVPNADFAGTATVTYRAWDESSGVAGTMVNPGSGMAFSTASDTATVTVIAMQDAPVLDNSGSPFLTDVAEDATDPAGDEVSAIVGSSITDVDAGALEGITVVAADSANGIWQFSIDGGASWDLLPAVSNSNALLLRSTDMLRFIPNTDFDGTATVTYRAWDRTAGGLAGGTASTMVVGGSSAFSVDTDTATVSIDSGNDAPILDISGSLPSFDAITSDMVDPPGVLLSTLIGSRISDPDPSALEGVAIIGFSTGGGGGTWQYSTDDGATYFDVPSVSDSTALLLRATDRVRFNPETTFHGTATVTFRAWDQTSGTAGGAADLTTVGATGGTSAFSVDSTVATITVSSGVIVAPDNGDSGDDGSSCSATEPVTGAAWGLLAVLMAMLASLRGLVGARAGVRKE